MSLLLAGPGAVGVATGPAAGPAPTGVGDLLELVRAPAALSVPGDVLLGTAAAGLPTGPRTALRAASSVCLYWGGMALNDYADRELDAVERPERPIPSGRVTPGTALAVATGLTAAGLALAAAAGGAAALRVAVPLAGTVWLYDLVLKDTPAGPAAMAAARGLDVLSGAAGSGRVRAALPSALVLAGHTAALTVLSRREVHGATPALPRATLAAGGLVAGTVLALGRRRGAAGRALTGLLAAGYLATAAPAQLAAVRAPSPVRVRRAVGAGIHAMAPLQAALSAAAGARGVALAPVLAVSLARRLARKVSPT